MKKSLVFMFFAVVSALILGTCAFAQDTVLVESNGDDLSSYHLVSNGYIDADGNGVNATATKKVVTGIGGKDGDDKSIHGYMTGQPEGTTRQNHKQHLSFGTSVYGADDCNGKYVVLEANFMPEDLDSIGILTLQPNAGLNISVTLTAADNVLKAGRWNHVRFVSDPATFDRENLLYPYTYVFVNGKLIKEGRPSGKYNTGYSHLPYRIMADLGYGEDARKEQSIYWDDFKVYLTDTKPTEYTMPSLYTDGKKTAVNGDILYIYEETITDELRGVNGEKVVVYDTASYDYILPSGAKLYDGNLICVSDNSGKISYYSVKKELKNVPSALLSGDGFKVSANLDGAVLVAAGYDFEGVLKELKFCPDDGVQTLEISGNCYSVKGFVFESLASLMPLTNVATASKNPTIGVWGASITAGQGGTSSYPGRIAELSGYNVYNMGIGGETQTTIAARQGGLDIKLTKDIVIPASGSVNIEFAAYNKDDGAYAGVVTPRNSAGAGWNPVNIAGVEGTLSIVVNGDVWPRVLKSATFTRKTAGEAVTVPAGTLMTVDGQDLKTDITIFTVSSNGGWTSENTTARDDQFEGLINILDRSIANCKYPDKILIVGLTTNTNKHWVKVHAALRAKYGDKFLDVRSYLASEQALIDSGITPTDTDRQLLAVGQIPASLISNYPDDPVHMNSAGYARMGECVYAKLVELGYISAE